MEVSKEVLRCSNLSRTYTQGDRALTVLHDVSFSLQEGEVCAITGPSGSGKTTLLGLAAGLDTPSDGEVHLCGEALSPLSEDARAAIRNRQVGFVFQSYRLIPTLTALENVMVPLEIGGAVARAEALRRATEGLEQVGMADRLDHYPTQLSGGEQQRVAIARAFVHQPKILFADEPTGNLDEDTSAQVESLLFGLNRDTHTALVLVTHDLTLAAKCARHIRLKGGRLVESGEVA